MPHPRPLETSGRVDFAVKLGMGAFLALLVLPIMLIRNTHATGAAVPLVLAGLAAANRSYLRYRNVTSR